MKIFKYEIDYREPEIKLPIGAKILSVGVQGQNLFLWAVVDEYSQLGTAYRRIHVFGTGETLPENPNLVFLGTVFMDNAALVLHVFEEIDA